MHMLITIPRARLDALTASQKATVLIIIIYKAIITHQAPL